MTAREGRQGKDSKERTARKRRKGKQGKDGKVRTTRQDWRGKEGKVKGQREKDGEVKR